MDATYYYHHDTENTKMDEPNNANVRLVMAAETQLPPDAVLVWEELQDLWQTDAAEPQSDCDEPFWGVHLRLADGSRHYLWWNPYFNMIIWT